MGIIGMISKRGFYVVRKCDLDAATVESVTKELTLVPIIKYQKVGNIHMRTPQPIVLGFESEQVDSVSGKKVVFLHVPRFYGLARFGPPAVDRLGSGRDIDVCFRGSLYKDQEEPVSYVLDALNKEYMSGGILSLPCGEGKTVTSIYVISRIKKKTLIVVHKEFLMNQWRDEIQQFLPGAKVGFIQGSVFQVHGYDIVLGMIQTMGRREYEFDDVRDFGLCIFDECHHLGAKMFSTVLQKVPARRMLGLSAEPLRKDGMNLVFEHQLGEVIYQRERQNSLKVNVYDFVFSSTSVNFQTLYDRHGNKLLYKMEENIVTLSERNIFIACLVNYLLEPGTPFSDKRQIIVLSARNEKHLPLLYEMIKRYKPECRIGYYVGRNGASKKVHEKMLCVAKDCQVILGTYDMAQEGLNIKTLNCILLASPLGGLQSEMIRGQKVEFSNDIKQTVGRILRDKSCVVPRLVFDFTDKFANFERWSAQRQKYYLKEHYRLKRVFVSLDAFRAHVEAEDTSQLLQSSTHFFAGQCQGLLQTNEGNLFDILLDRKCVNESNECSELTESNECSELTESNECSELTEINESNKCTERDGEKSRKKSAKRKVSDFKLDPGGNLQKKSGCMFRLAHLAE